MFDILSEELKQAREKLGLTLQQLAGKSRIDIKFLEAMDEGNFAFLPELYVKAFLKEYARFVGLKEEIIIKKYEALKSGKPVDEITSSPPPQEEKKDEKPAVKRVHPIKTYNISPEDVERSIRNKNKNLIIYAAAAGAAVLIILAIFLLRGGDDKIIVEKPYEDILEESQPRFEVDSTTIAGDTINYIQNGDSLRLSITSSDSCWVKVITDDNMGRTEDFMLKPGWRKEVSALRNFNITFGNSKGISLRLNNQPINFNNRGSVVTNVLIDSTGLKYLNTTP